MKQVVGNRELASKVRRSVQSGKQIKAIVKETFFDRVSVQLAGNGQLMRNLPIIGGPVDVGDVVKVDFSSTPPQVVATGKTWLTADELDNVLARMGNLSVASDGPTISIVLFSGGASLEMYPSTADGLGYAIQAAGDGDVIWLPDVEISGDFIVPDGVTLSGVSSRQSIIKGTITIGNNCALENIKIVKTTWTNEADVIAVDVP